MVINRLLIATFLFSNLAMAPSPVSAAPPAHGRVTRALAARVDSFSPRPRKKPKKKHHGEPRVSQTDADAIDSDAAQEEEAEAVPARRQVAELPARAKPQQSEVDADESEAPEPTSHKAEVNAKPDDDESATHEAVVTKGQRPSSPRRAIQQDDQQDDQEDFSKPRPDLESRRRMARSEEDEEEDDVADETGEMEDGESMPVILPHLISVVAGGSVMGRSFRYNTALESERTFPRSGLAVAAESYPFIGSAPEWFSRIGLGASLAIEYGAAALSLPSGLAVSLPVAQRRWSVDVRYAIPIGERLLIVPSLGYGGNSFDLKTSMPLPPSMCTGASASGAVPPPCLADVDGSLIVLAADMRFAAGRSLSFSLAAGYVVGLQVGKGVGQIAAEKNTAMTGFQGELAANLMVLDWMALRVGLPLVRYGYSFAGGNAEATYSSASETYYGLTAGAVVFVP